MNLRWRSLVGVVLIGLAAGLAGGCEDDDPFRDNWKFSNQSSYRVTVEPNGQYWLSVVIGPGHSVEVEYDGDRIQFIEADPRIGHGPFDRRAECLQVRARCHFRHDAAELSMYRHLRRYYVR